MAKNLGGEFEPVGKDFEGSSIHIPAGADQVPGISEALINTAAGLFAAIPALLAYNHFVGRLRQAKGEMEDFTLEFLNLTERNFT